MERHTYIRIAKIDELIRNKRYPNCKFLADEFETTERTILRDIEAMKDSLGAPIRYSKEHNGYYYESDSPTLPAIRLTEGEIVSIFLGSELIKKFKNTPFSSSVRSAFEKIELLLPKEVSIDFEDLNSAFSIDIDSTKELDKRSAAVFDTLAKAIKNRTSVEALYYTIYRDKTERRVIDPYHLRHTLGAWYLIAYCHKRKEIRTFAIDRFREIKVLKKKFEVEKGFSIEKFLEGVWRLERGGKPTNVSVRFSPRISRWIRERKWHPSQKTVENKDGSVTLTFNVQGTNEIMRWVRSFGEDARVVETGA